MVRRLLPFVACLLICTSASPACAGLVSRWAFDEESGTTAFDMFNGFNGTLEGQASFAPSSGIRGGAVELDEATSDLVNMGDHHAFTGGAAFSIQAWVKTTKTTSQLVVARHVATVIAGYILGLNDIGDGPPNEASGSFHIYQSDNPQFNSGDQGINDGQWHQIVAARDATAMEVRLYVDGNRVPGSTSSGSLSLLAPTSAPFLVGGILFGETRTGTFTGMIDEVRVYDHALGDFEVNHFFRHPDTLFAVRCGDINVSETVTASDALYVLKTAVGSETCDLCLCDANGSETITASDAQLVLKVAVGQDVATNCPGCPIPN